MWRFGLGGITGINFGMSDIRDFGRESCVLNGEKKGANYTPGITTCTSCAI
jgi:hypothetical protein